MSSGMCCLSDCTNRLLVVEQLNSNSIPLTDQSSGDSPRKAELSGNHPKRIHYTGEHPKEEVTKVKSRLHSRVFYLIQLKSAITTMK